MKKVAKFEDEIVVHTSVNDHKEYIGRISIIDDRHCLVVDEFTTPLELGYSIKSKATQYWDRLNYNYASDEYTERMATDDEALKYKLISAKYKNLKHYSL